MKEKDKDERNIIFKASKNKGFNLDNIAYKKKNQFQTNCIDLQYLYHTFDIDTAQKGD